jgi:glycosyltransferase involved in cell wall biosynthesis
MAREMAKHHEVWVLTRSNNRMLIEAELTRNPVQSLHFVYYDFPRWSRWWKRGSRGVQVYYYLWQLRTYLVARRLQRHTHFDLAHHVTFGKCWSPSGLALLRTPLIWGPVGGGESAPRAFWLDLGVRGFLFEVVRELARWIAAHDPFVQLTARRSRLVLVKNEDTEHWVRRRGSSVVRICSESAMSESDLDRLSQSQPSNEGQLRFISIGKLLHWKGFHLGLRAFAEAALRDAEYWIVGDGPERERWRQLARRLGINQRTIFWGHLPRAVVLAKLRASHVLVHPSLHDSGGWVCLEAMAAGKPVICLDLGGPATQVTPHTGYAIGARSPQQTIQDLAAAMTTLAGSPELRAQMEQAARERILGQYVWDRKGRSLDGHYREVARMVPCTSPESRAGSWARM